LVRDFDTLFDRLTGGRNGPSSDDMLALRVWDFDVTENDKEVVVRAEVPGFEESELDVQINQDVLTIKTEKEQKGDGQEEYRTFFRAVTLPPGIDAERAHATYRNGVLELHIPRAAGSQPKRVAIQGGQAGSGQPGAAGQNGAGRSETGQRSQSSGQQSEATAPGQSKK
jgi:HSP20 family protein